MPDTGSTKVIHNRVVMLVFTGGGVHGAYQAALFSQMHKNGAFQGRLAAMFGASAGAFNAATILYGLSTHRCPDRLQKDLKASWDGVFWNFDAAAFAFMPYGEFAMLKQRIDRSVPDWAPLRNSATELTILAAEKKDGAYHPLPFKGQDLGAEAFLASAAMINPYYYRREERGPFIVCHDGEYAGYGPLLTESVQKHGVTDLYVFLNGPAPKRLSGYKGPSGMLSQGFTLSADPLVGYLTANPVEGCALHILDMDTRGLGPLSHNNPILIPECWNRGLEKAESIASPVYEAA